MPENAAWSRPTVLRALEAGAPLKDAAAAAGTTPRAVLRLAQEDGAWYADLMSAEAHGALSRQQAVREGREVTWAEAAAVTTSTEPPRMRPVHDPADRWGTVRVEAKALASGPLGTLMWIDARCQLIDMHPLDAWWIETFASFYASGKMVLTGRVGLRGAKSVSIPRALVNDALFAERSLDPGTVGVIPIMSTDRTEATDRFVTIRKILRACGFSPAKPDDLEGMIPGGGLAGEYTATTLPSGGGVIRTTDSQGHAIEFRIYPAKRTGAVGYTGIGGFCDEVDLWVDDKGANPAEEVLDLLLNRFTTQPTARLYIFSASYHATSAHARKVAEGDTMIQHVARLGVLGAARDTAARRALAALIKSADPRLLEASNPASRDVGAWVCNPSAPIDRCYALSKERLGMLLARYGGRPSEAPQADGTGQCVGLAERTRELNAKLRVAAPPARSTASGVAGWPPTNNAVSIAGFRRGIF